MVNGDITGAVGTFTNLAILGTGLVLFTGLVGQAQRNLEQPRRGRKKQPMLFDPLGFNQKPRKSKRRKDNVFDLEFF